ncbi:MAG: HAMP domain-containing histidine kinase [Burkholderiales bacterium]|nr:HAMP domain-containing histidine kinase [Burkholderiales bacterium]
MARDAALRARRFGHRLYLRIWLAVLLGLAATALLAFAALHLAGDARAPRTIALVDATGRPAGHARLDVMPAPGTVRVALDDGRVLFARWSDAAGQRRAPGFGWWLALIVAAVGLAAYPVARRLTRRLERLRAGVDAHGGGDLAARVEVRGHDEIAYLADRFNHAAARIEALVAKERDLLANASHELRSPLARLRMSIELLGRGDDTRVRAGIARDIGELDALIEEILLASRLGASGAPPEPFADVDLTALAAEECARADIRFEADGALRVHGSTRLLRRCLRNLLDNARRHAGAGGDAMVRLAQTGDRVVLRVGDRGPGVADDERERIFEPFHRARGASEADGGVGLGLALVRAIAARHGGTARCAARSGGGAWFIVELPAAAAAR